MKTILILAGLSGVGKTTVVHALLNRTDRFEFVRSITTRAPRGDGFDSEYIYLTKADFDHMIEKGLVLEYTEYAGNFYGTPITEIYRISSEGKIPLLILDLKGVHTVKTEKNDISACAVYITVEHSLLLSRLDKRYGGDKEKLMSRLEKNAQETSFFKEISKDFFAVVDNSLSIEKTVDEILALIEEFEKTSRE